MPTTVATRWRPKRPRPYIAVTRQMRALAWMGHGPKEVGALVRKRPADVARWIQRGEPLWDWVPPLSEQAFEKLSGHFGPNEEIAAKARELKWAPPLAWYDVDITNPYVKPRYGLTSSERISDYPLDSQVFQALIGVIGAADLIAEEKSAVVGILHRSMGWSDRRIAAWLRWSDDVELGQRAVCKWRERAGITGYGWKPDNARGTRADDEFIVTPAAA